MSDTQEIITAHHQLIMSRLDGLTNRFDDRLDGLTNRFDDRFDDVGIRLDALTVQVAKTNGDMTMAKVDIAVIKPQLEGIATWRKADVGASRPVRVFDVTLVITALGLGYAVLHAFGKL